MASTLDTTVGGPDADSYVSVDETDDYHDKHGNDDWSDGDDTSKDQAIRRATIYIDGVYRGRWKGGIAVTSPRQALAWPRIKAVDEDFVDIPSTSIPRVLKFACAEAALRELRNPGSLTPDFEQPTRIERVGPIEVEYVPGTERRADVTIITDLLSGLLTDSSIGTSVSFFARA